jgi:hypothetical protein
MKALRKAAGVLLEELGVRAEAEHSVEAHGFQIERMTCEVRGAQRSELVSLRLDEGRLAAVCSCGEPRCAHVCAVLQLMAAEPAGHAAHEATGKHTRSDRPPIESRSSEVPVAPLQLGDALADVVTAVVRAGVCTDRVASVLENLSRVERALPEPLPLGLLRWLGRMREAIDAQDTALAAQALAAAAAVTADLRSAQLQPEAHVRLSTWFGAAAQTLVRLSDRSLIEVAREWLHGNTRNQIERRYLIDLDSGECFREECVRGDRSASVGPCPRLVGVSLAEVEPSCAPRRLRLLQYTTTPNLERTHWDNLASWGQRDSEALLTAYRSAIAELGALAEPFALTAPRSLTFDARPSLVFERGAALPLFADDDSGVLKHCERIARSATVVWVAGRLLEHAGQLMLRPLALGLSDASGPRYERL